MNNLALISEQRDFVVSSSSLKDVRNFSREVFEKVNIDQDLKDELVLAIAEAKLDSATITVKEKGSVAQPKHVFI